MANAERTASKDHWLSTSSAKQHDNSSERTLDVEPALVVPGKQNDDGPPDGGYGWVCVACNFFINACTWGINSTYGVFLSNYLANDYFPNTSALTYAFIGGLSISMAVLVAPLATFVISRFGTKVCLHTGVFFETLSLIGASFAKSQYQIILAQGVCFGWGMGFLFVGSVGILSQWFVRKRSVANAIAAAGSGMGALVWSLSTQRMIDTLGLPWAFRILGIMAGTVNLVASNVLRDRNSQVGARHKAFDFAMLKRPEFLLLQGWSWFSMLGYTIVLFSLPSYSTSIGLSLQQGSIVGAMLNLGQMLGRPFIGLASDRWGRLNLATLFTALCGVFCFIFWIPSEATAHPMGLLIFFAIVGGALAGTFWATIAPVGAEVVGLKDLPGALSWTWLIMVPPTTFAEPIGLELRRQGASDWIYINCQIFTGCMYIAAALCLWLVRGWKVGELEEAARRDNRVTPTARALVGSEKHVRGEDSIEKGGIVPQGHESESVVTGGWKLKDLVRRMCCWKIV